MGGSSAADLPGPLGLERPAPPLHGMQVKVGFFHLNDPNCYSTRSGNVRLWTLRFGTCPYLATDFEFLSSKEGVFHLHSLPSVPSLRCVLADLSNSSLRVPNKRNVVLSGLGLLFSKSFSGMCYSPKVFRPVAADETCSVMIVIV